MYSRKKTAEETPYAMTAIWSCTHEACNGWMRDDFAFDPEPACPKCGSVMIGDMRSLPVIANTSRTSKTLKPSMRIAD